MKRSWIFDGSRPEGRLAALLVVMMAAGTGCQSGGIGALARWRMAFDQSVASSPTTEEVGDSGSLLKRWVQRNSPGTSSLTEKSGSTLVLGSDGWSPMKPPSDPVAEAEFAGPEKLFKEGQFEQAEKEFLKIARKRKGAHWGEKAQYYLAESQYQQGHLRTANDSFEELIKTYPGTQFLDKAVAREFAIAKVWLAAVDPKAKPEEKATWRDRFSGKLPPLDASGYALAALEHVRHNDPNGPLSDDAVMKIADYHYMHKNWDEAAIYYDQLIGEHPKSPFVQQALLSSIDAKLKGYLGPDYDGTGLERAREQVNVTMTSFPERQVSHSESLHHVLDVINEQSAERAYKVGEHYLWTGKVAAAEYCFGEIPVKWPKSPYAAKAKEQLAHIATMPRKETKASRIMTRPGSSDPMTGASGVGAGGIGPSGMNGPNGMGGMGMGGMGGP